MTPFKACIVQTTSLPYDKQANLDRALRAMETAAGQGASLILFPEMFLTGYLIKDKLSELAESLEDGPALTVLRRKAQELSMGVVIGTPPAKLRRQALQRRGDDRPGRLHPRLSGQDPLLWRRGKDVRPRRQLESL